MNVCATTHIVGKYWKWDKRTKSGTYNATIAIGFQIASKFPEITFMLISNHLHRLQMKQTIHIFCTQMNLCWLYKHREQRAECQMTASQRQRQSQRECVCVYECGSDIKIYFYLLFYLTCRTFTRAFKTIWHKWNSVSTIILGIRLIRAELQKTPKITFTICDCVV